MAEAIDLGEGAVAVIDALGFKAARHHLGVQRLIRSVRDSRALAATVNQLLAVGGVAHFAAFSDTIIIARTNGPTLSQSILSVAVSAWTLMASARVADAPLAYRGCIAAGELVVVDEIFVGRAIDDAAEWCERADVSAVWLTPGAADAATAHNEDHALLFPWAVPIKGVGALQTLVVNPFFLGVFFCVQNGEPAEDHVRDLRAALLKPFEGSQAIDVAMKRQNTLALLDAAADQALASEALMKELAAKLQETDRAADGGKDRDA